MLIAQLYSYKQAILVQNRLIIMVLLLLKLNNLAPTLVVDIMNGLFM